MDFWNRLVPELAVRDFSRSKVFYQQVFGFRLCFERPEDQFAYFDLDGAQIMILQAQAGDLYQLDQQTPRGRGLHLQIEVDDVATILERVQAAQLPLVKPLVDSWYRADNVEHGSREFFVHDLDGYLFRFYQPLGERIV
jgi:catechol 2,3-dioxygenase-like lactoylglutathione lyase family enzyme